MRVVPMLLGHKKLDTTALRADAECTVATSASSRKGDAARSKVNAPEAAKASM